MVAPRAFVTLVSGFSNVTNAGDGDVVHLLGDSARNVLTGGTAADLIVGGRGTAGDGSSDIGAGQHGDRLTGGAGADIFLYRSEIESPGGTIAGGQAGGSEISANNEFNVVNSRDTVTDFAVGSDKLAFVIDDTFDAVRVASSLPPSLASTANSVLALATSFALGSTGVDIGKLGSAAATADRLDNYSVDSSAATLSLADLVLRVNATSGGDIIDASAGLATGALNLPSADGLRVDVVYSAAAQSQSGGFDQIIHFRSGSDHIDLSFLHLARSESQRAGNGVNFDNNHNNIVDALETGLVRTLGGAPIFAINSPVPSLFDDAGTYRPIAVQAQAGTGGTSTVVFVDADGNGNYDPAADMVLVLVGVGTVASSDFIVDLYGGGWGV